MRIRVLVALKLEKLGKNPSPRPSAGELAKHLGYCGFGADEAYVPVYPLHKPFVYIRGWIDEEKAGILKKDETVAGVWPDLPQGASWACYY